MQKLLKYYRRHYNAKQIQVAYGDWDLSYVKSTVKKPGMCTLLLCRTLNDLSEEDFMSLFLRGEYKKYTNSLMYLCVLIQNGINEFLLEDIERRRGQTSSKFFHQVGLFSFYEPEFDYTPYVQQEKYTLDENKKHSNVKLYPKKPKKLSRLQDDLNFMFQLEN